MNMHESIAGFDVAALLDIDIGHSTGHLAGDAHLRCIGLTLHGVGSLLYE